jgi:uncharacterized repeat protein (TIGR01451 family)
MAQRHLLQKLRLAAAGTVLMLVTSAFIAGRAEAGGLPPTDPNRPGGLPAQGDCGEPAFGGVYVKFTVPGIDGTIVAQPTAGAPAAATVVQNSTDEEFTILSATYNGSPAVIAEVIGGVRNLNPIWSFSPPTLAPTPVLDVTDSGNFSQFALCLYTAGALTVNKTVDAGSGTFQFEVICRGLDGTVILTKTFSLTASAGSPGSMLISQTLPVGASCTATETVIPTGWVGDGPKTVAIVATGSEITINNRQTAVPQPNISIVKTIDPAVLSPTQATATFSITVSNTGAGPATNVVVTDVVDPVLTVTNVSGPGTWLAPTWTIGSISPGGSVTLQITVNIPLTVALQYPPQPKVENCAVVAYTEDPTPTDPANNTSCVTVRRSAP